MDINFEYCKVFYFVAKYGNLTRAAAALGSSQPNVTRVVRLLEAQLHCRLFSREARGIRLTEEGKALYAHVEIAYSHLQRAGEELCGRDAQLRGTVTVGATETALHLFLLELLQAFKLEYPAVRIRLQNRSTPETVKCLLSGGLDFAVVTTPLPPCPTLSRVKALEFEEILVGGTQYAQLSRAALEPCDIGRYPLVGLGGESATCRFYKEFFAAHGVDWEPDMEVATSDLLLPLLEKNAGIGFVPEKMAAPLLAEKRLVRIPFHGRLPARSVQIVADKGRAGSRTADAFHRFCVGRAEK